MIFQISGVVVGPAGVRMLIREHQIESMFQCLGSYFVNVLRVWQAKGQMIQPWCTPIVRSMADIGTGL
ncbi:hypothetical protein AQ436_02775 [Arthrobacter sp. EpRS66]|nr:hypothetical protein AQ436_02775 [Arthrobacter sp. EpRS66]